VAILPIVMKGKSRGSYTVPLHKACSYHHIRGISLVAKDFERSQRFSNHLTARSATIRQGQVSLPWQISLDQTTITRWGGL